MNNGRMTFRFDDNRDKYKPIHEESNLKVVRDSSGEKFGEHLEEDFGEGVIEVAGEGLVEETVDDLGDYRREIPRKDYGRSSMQGRGAPSGERRDSRSGERRGANSWEDRDSRRGKSPGANSPEKVGSVESMWSYIPELEFSLSDPPEDADKGYEHLLTENQLDDRFNDRLDGRLDDRFNDRLDSRLDDRFDDPPDFPLLENISRSEAGYGRGSSFYSRRPSHLWKFALSAAGAIGTGLLLGYAALSFFNAGYTPDGAVIPTNNTVPVGNEVVGAGDDPAGVGTSGLPLTESGDAVAHHISVQVEEQKYYMLQYGVFSTPTGAEQAQQELLTAGLAASIDPSDGNRVYAGISPNREQAKLLSNGLKSQGIELYVREVTLPAVNQLAFEGSAETMNNYFDVSGRLLGGLSTLSASLLNNGTGTLTTSDISNLHLEWTEAVRALHSGSPPEALSIITALEKSISQGISAWSEYNKNKSDGLLWEIQGSVMNSLNEQKRLLSALN